MTSVISPVTKIKFDAQMFSSLQLQEWIPGYNRIGIDQLLINGVCDDSTYLVLFLASCSESGDYDESDVLSIKASENGILEQVYGPIVLASEDGSELVLRCGANIFPISQNKNEFTLGSLTGEIVPFDLKFKDKETGIEKIISIPQIEFTDPSDDTITYLIRIRTKEGVDGDGLKRTAKNGKPIAPFLNPVKSGASSIFKMAEFPEGEYLIKDIQLDEAKGKKDWISYTLFLEGDKAVWDSPSLRDLLSKNYQVFKSYLASGKAVTLKVAKTRNKKGKEVMDAGIFLRSPKAITPAKTTPELPSAPVAVAPVVQAESEAIDVTATTEEISEPKLPF